MPELGLDRAPPLQLQALLWLCGWHGFSEEDGADELTDIHTGPSPAQGHTPGERGTPQTGQDSAIVLSPQLRGPSLPLLLI